MSTRPSRVKGEVSHQASEEKPLQQSHTRPQAATSFFAAVQHGSAYGDSQSASKTACAAFTSAVAFVLNDAPAVW